MIRMRHFPYFAGFQRIDRVEGDDLDPRVAQALKKRSGSTETAPAVIDEIHLDAFRLFFQQQIGKSAACLIVLE